MKYTLEGVCMWGCIFSVVMSVVCRLSIVIVRMISEAL